MKKKIKKIYLFFSDMIQIRNFIKLSDPEPYLIIGSGTLFNF